MLLDDVEEVARSVVTREYHGLTTEGSHLGTSNVEHVAVAGQPGEVEVAAVGHEAVAETGTVDEERHVVLLAEVVEPFYFSRRIDSAELGWEGDVDDTGYDHVLIDGVGIEARVEVLQVVGTQFPVVRWQDDDFVPTGLDGSRLVYVDMSAVDGDDTLVARQDAIDDGSICLSTAYEEVDVGIGALTCLAYFLTRRLTPLVEAIRLTLLIVALYEAAQHVRVGTVIIVALE